MLKDDEDGPRNGAANLSGEISYMRQGIQHRLQQEQNPARKRFFVLCCNTNGRPSFSLPHARAMAACLMSQSHEAEKTINPLCPRPHRSLYAQFRPLCHSQSRYFDSRDQPLILCSFVYSFGSGLCRTALGDLMAPEAKPISSPIITQQLVKIRTLSVAMASRATGTIWTLHMPCLVKLNRR